MHGFGRDHLQVSTEYTDAAPYYMFHKAWDYLDYTSRANLCQLPVMNAYAHLRTEAGDAPVHTLRSPRPQYDGEPINQNRVRLTTLALIRFDFNYGDFAKFLAGEYNYQQRDWKSVFNIIETFEATDPPTAYSEYKKGEQPPADIARVKRIVDVGVPLVGHYKCSYSSVSQRNVYNNHPNISPVKQMVHEKLAKEEALSYQVVFLRWIWRFIPGLFLAAISFKSPKHIGDGGRLCTDLATHLFPGDDGMLNEQMRRPARPSKPEEITDEHHLDENPPIYYGNALLTLLSWIWNLRIDHPFEDILIAANDISAAFHRILYNSAMAICFAVVFDRYLAVPVGNVFGAKNSASLYMTKGELRSWLARVANFDDATTTLGKSIELPPPPTPAEADSISQAVRDDMNPGSHALRQGPLQLGPQPSFVDDTGAADVREKIMQAIENSILSAYVMFGFPAEDPRRPAINATKFDKQVTHILKFLGFIINTRDMTVEWPQDKRERLAKLLDEHFLQPSSQRPPLTPKIVSQILGLVRNGATASPYGVYLSLRLQYELKDAVSAASKNKPPDHHWWRRPILHPKPDVYADIRLLRSILTGANASNYWTRPIGLLVDRTPTAYPIGDACYEGMGAYCKEVSCMWRITNTGLRDIGFDIPEDDADMLQRVQAAKRSGNTQEVEHLTHNNILEFVTVIVSLWLTIALSTRQHPPNKLHVFHPRTDNTSALSWLMYAARTKRAPIRRLARFCQFMLTTAPILLRLQPSWIWGKDNDDADILSRPATRAKSWESVIELISPELKSCQIYQIPRELLSLLAKIIKQDVPEAELEAKMTKLWTLEPTTLNPGSTSWAMTHGVSKRSHRSKRRR